MDTVNIRGYRLIKMLGLGGEDAEVWLAEKNGNKYAIKFLKIQLGKTLTKEEAEDFRDKASLWKKLDHPNIVRVIEFGLEPLPYIVMELCQKDLRTVLREKIRLDPDEAIAIGLQVAKALEYAHHHGVVHRDIKPENILICGGKVKVADWGIAKILLKTSAKTGYAGTPIYSAPEQLDPNTYGKVDWRTDIWQLGCLLYEMLEGEPPFYAEHPGQLVLSILSQPPRPFKHTPEWLGQIIMRCLNKRKEERWRSISIIIEMLETKTIPRISAPTKMVAPQVDIEQEFMETLKTIDTKRIEKLLEKLEEQYKEKPTPKNALMLGTIKDIMGIPTNIIWQTIKIAEDEIERIAQELDNDEVYVSLGNGYLQIWRLEKAEKYYKKALRKNLENTRALIGLAWINHYMCRHEEAINIANQALQKQKNIEALLIKAWALYALGRKNEDVYRRLIDIPPKTIREQTIHAYAKSIIGQREGKSTIKNILKKYPNYAKGWRLLGLIESTYDEAIRCWRKAVEINPDYAVAWYNMGDAYDEKGDYDEAIRCYRKAVEINPDYAVAWYNMGFAYYRKRDYSNARMCFKRACDLGYREGCRALKRL